MPPLITDAAIFAIADYAAAFSLRLRFRWRDYAIDYFESACR